MRAVCGLDVHKDSVFLCILCETGEIFEKVYGVLTHELQSMCRDMKRRGVTEVSMESTSVYWIPIWRVLEPHFCDMGTGTLTRTFGCQGTGTDTDTIFRCLFI